MFVLMYVTFTLTFLYFKTVAYVKVYFLKVIKTFYLTVNRVMSTKIKAKLDTIIILAMPYR